MTNISKRQWERFKRQPLMVWLLLGIQVLVYLGMTLTGLKYGLGFNGSESTGVLLLFGAMEKDLVLEFHQYWRFITPIFVHIGLMHLIVNSLTLYFIGTQLETLLGHGRFLLVYLLSGVSGNLVSFAFGQPHTISAGASTSLFGLFGVFVALGRVYQDHPTIRFMAQRMLTLVVMNLVFNLFSTQIDILGHIGGVLGGFLLGLIVSVPSLKGSQYDFYKRDVHQKIRAVILLVFLFVLCIAYAFRNQLGF